MALIIDRRWFRTERPPLFKTRRAWRIFIASRSSSAQLIIVQFTFAENLLVNGLILPTILINTISRLILHVIKLAYCRTFKQAEQNLSIV